MNSLISNVAILTPENTCIQLRGTKISAENVMDYKKEALLGEHISNLQPSLTNSNKMVIRSFMPIRKSGKTLGLLYAEMSPENIARAWSPTIYNNSCTFCIIDRESGEFLVNNWNAEVRNLNELPSESLGESIRKGKTTFREITEKDGSQTYLSYMPMELEKWEVLVSVSQKEVFKKAHEVQNLMMKFLFVLILLLVLYLFWMLHANRLAVLYERRQANTDILTGLQNRNQYERSDLYLC